MPTNGLYYGVDFVLTFVYAKEDFSENSFVVKVKGSSVNRQSYQKYKVYRSFNSDQLCIKVGGDKYILLNEDGTNYVIGGSVVGNYVDYHYSLVPVANPVNYNSNFLGIYSAGNWLDWTTSFTGITAVNPRNTATIPTTNEVFLAPKDPTAWKYYGNGADLTMDIYTLNLSAYNPTTASDKANKILFDNEIAYIRGTPSTREAFSGGYVVSTHLARIVRQVRNASGSNAPRGLLIEEAYIGMWIDKVTKMRVNYIGLNLALSTQSATVYSIVNKDLLPVDFFKPADLGLEEIVIPTLPEPSWIASIASFLAYLIDVKTVFTIAALYLGYLYISGSGDIQTFRNNITGGAQ